VIAIFGSNLLLWWWIAGRATARHATALTRRSTNPRCRVPG
jgi:hypothetical protein